MVKASEKTKAIEDKASKSIVFFDYFRWIAAAIFLGAGFAANYYFISEPLSLRLIGWLFLSGMVLWIALRTTQGKKAWQFFTEARGEMRKVVWPTRQETFKTTLTIIAIVALFSILMWGIDALLMWAVSLLTG